MHTPHDDATPLTPFPPAPLDDAEFAPQPPASAHPPQALCANCGAALLGPHCHACGQPVKGMIRHLSSILADVVDSVLNIDSRIFRTILPLYLRPGWLTNEYFTGRRVRYVTPFRLYFFLSVAAFFLIQFALDDVNLKGNFVIDASGINKALTRAEVERQRDDALAHLKAAQADGSEGDAVELEPAIARVRKNADKRIAWIERVDAAKAKGETPPPDPASDDITVQVGGMPWDQKKHPIAVSWLPQFANDKLNAMAAHARGNLARITTDPKPFLLGSISVLPQVLFVLMPLFALMLKVFYLFKRRLYMEHIVVALHSHAFLFLSLILITLTAMASGWAGRNLPWLQVPLTWAFTLMNIWLPLYLFLMQKKVYRQGWIMTTMKFCAIGVAYSVLIGLGAACAVLVSLATT